MQNNVLYCERSEYVDGCFWVLQLFSSISVILCVGGGGGRGKKGGGFCSISVILGLGGVGQ